MNRRKMLVSSAAPALFGFVVMLSNGALAQSAKDIVGTYTVASFWNVQGDKRTELYGPHPKGLMRLDASGRYVVVLMRPDLPKFASNNRTTGTAEEYKAIAMGAFVHLGTYTVADGHIIFHLENTTYPNWDGEVQKRKLTVTGDELKYEVQPSSHLRLVRMRGKAAPGRQALLAGDAWRASQELLAQSSAAPRLSLSAGNA